MTTSNTTSSTNTSSSLDFGFGEVETELRDVARRFLGDQFPITTLRELVASDPEAVYLRGEPTSWDKQLWTQIVDMGWTGLAVPEAAGGTPVAMAGLAAVVEETGFHALPSPLTSTINASLVLNSCEPDAARPWLEAIASGTTATIATTDDTGSWQAAHCTVKATPDGDGYRLDGVTAFVQDAAKADLFVVLCQTDTSHIVAVVRADAEGLTVAPNHIHDLTRDQATLHFDSLLVEANAVVSTNGVAAIEAAWPGVLVMAAADLCGVAEWLLQTTTEYATNRVQFDHPIGFFQAVKHPIVNVTIDIARARSLLYHAASLVDSNPATALAAARMAKSAASDAASFAADRTVQLHGGIGFTWEHDAHIYFKRAMHGQALYGGGQYQRQQLANTLIGPIS